MTLVALTYDDGPSKWTPALLDVLAEADASATFFVLGSQIDGREEILRRAVAEGHELGLHGWDHARADSMSPLELLAQLTRAHQMIVVAAPDAKVRWWRAPWNDAPVSHAALVATDGLGYCRSTVDAGDVSRTEDWIVGNVLRNLRHGAIVGLHDGIASNGQQVLKTRAHTVRATARILEHCDSVTVSELLA